jgi:uncharacterized membrane protein YidH (DUF202 family)
MTRTTLLLFMILIGIVIVALPDSNVRLFSISKEHGPSLQDAIGLVLVLIPYAILVTQAWRQREKVLKYKNSKWFKTSLFLFGLGTGLLIASVLSDYNYWWICGIILLVGVQTIAFYLALR